MEGKKEQRKWLQMPTLTKQTHESGMSMKVGKLKEDGEKGGNKCST
jgi:hypothetical protein